jgi:hypothetical protein
MKITLNQTSALGQEFVLTLDCPDLTEQQGADLSTNEGDSRIYTLLRRELNRCVEIATVSLQDADAQRKQAKIKLPKADPNVPKPAAQIVGAGSKKPENRLVEHDGKFVPAPELPKTHALHPNNPARGRE